MDNESVIIENNKEAGLKILRPYSKWRGGLMALLIKGILSFVSAIMVFNLIFYGFNIECDYVLMTKIIFAVSFIFTILQINNIILAFSYVFVAFKTYVYILNNTEVLKNGVMTMANQCYPIISNALNLPSADGFDNVLVDTYLTVNSVTGIAAVAISIIMVTIVVKLNSGLFYAIGMSVVFAILSFFNCEVKYEYASILLLGFVLAVVLSLCSVKGFRLSVLSLLYKKKSKVFKFKSDLSYILQIAVVACIMFMVISQGFRFFYGPDKFNATFNDEYSENIKVTARDIAVMKYAEYKNFNLEKNTSLGQLGYVAYTKPNFKNIIFRFVTEPVTEGKLYFTSFVGQDYKFRYNNWTESQDNNSVMINTLKDANAFEKKFEIYTGEHKSYIPSYAEYRDYEYDNKNKSEIIAYEYKNINIDDESYNDYVKNTYLSIDEENKSVLNKICEEHHFSKEDSNIDYNLAEYLKNNFTYSTECETIPYGKDFVNYFLEESKTGNFAQFATALTLLYRNIGIPARYVSGYAVDAKQTLIADNAGGGRTNTAVKAANLYSWVEIYNSEGGWQIVDIIPAPDIEELEEKYGEESENTYTPDTSIENYFRTIDKEKCTPANIAKIGLNVVLKLMAIIILVFVIVLVFAFTGIVVYRNIIFSRSDNSKKAYILMERLRNSLKIKSVSYRDMKKVLTEKYGSERAVAIIELAEKCIFSNNVSNEDIKRLKKLIRK